MNNEEENPGETKEKDETIQNKKGGWTEVSILFGRPIEPENLGENNKWYRTVTRIKQY
jgi:hypothetical protein